MDQIAHFFGAVVIIAIILKFPWLGGFLVGFVREQGQRWMTNREIAWKPWRWGQGSKRDMIFWTLGGLLYVG